MPKGYSAVLASARTAGTARNTFTAAVTLLPDHARCPMTPYDWFEGRVLRVMAAGSISNLVTTQPTFTFEFRLGPTANIVAFTTGANLTSATVHTNVPWWLDILLTVRAVGSGTAANIMGQGLVTSRAFLDAGTGGDLTTLGHASLLAPETAPAVGTGFDSTVVNVADLLVSCSASNVGNAIQLHQYILEDLN